MRVLYRMAVGLLAVIYLACLELFVIEAVCIWCVSYAVTVVSGWLVAVFALRGAVPLEQPPTEAGPR